MRAARNGGGLRAEAMIPAEAVVELRRRTPAGQMRYLAAKLSEGERWRLPVALALEILAEETDAAEAGPGPAAAP
jgi:hypothetical protein